MIIIHIMAAMGRVAGISDVPDAFFFPDVPNKKDIRKNEKSSMRW
jgi:hypothetical protein